MKTATAALINYLNETRPVGDAPLCVGDLFTIWLANGVILTTTNLDLPVAWNGAVFSASSVLISRLRYRCSLGLNVDSQQVTLLARPSDLLGGLPFMEALQAGAFDGAIIQREKAVFASWATTAGALVPIGAVVMFKGRVATIEHIGRTTAQITVAADTVFLDIDMPRRLWSPQCTHVLYDSGCALARGTFSKNGVVGASSTVLAINWSGTLSSHQLGAVTFTNGVNAGIIRTVKTATAGSGFSLAGPLPQPPAAGDTFTIAQGCDHTMATCQSSFNNLSNFRGYPFVPPPQVVTGPLSTTWASQSGKGK